jgi:hypothetical protein
MARRDRSRDLFDLHVYDVHAFTRKVDVVMFHLIQPFGGVEVKIGTIDVHPHLVDRGRDYFKVLVESLTGHESDATLP